MVKITRWSYSRLISTERFGNVKVEASGDVEDGEDPEAAFDALRRSVDYKALERKHRIEGTIGDGDEEPQPRAAQFRPNNGGGWLAQSLRGDTLGGSLYNADGDEIARARGMTIGGTIGEQTATMVKLPHPIRSYLVPPQGGAMQVTLSSGGDGVLTMIYPDGTEGPRFNVDGHELIDWQNDPEAYQWVIGTDGRVALEERAAPPAPWLQLHQEAGVAWLEHMGQDDYKRIELAPGFAHVALADKLIVPRHGQPGMTWGDGGETAFRVAHANHAALLGNGDGTIE